jgi:hypothetical protein
MTVFQKSTSTTFQRQGAQRSLLFLSVLRFYQLGTVLKVVSREKGWVQVPDPTSKDTGWVFERYLVPAAGPTVTQTALATTTNKAVTTRAKPVLIATNRVKASRPTVRIQKSVALAQFDRRWDQRREPRGIA